LNFQPKKISIKYSQNRSNYNPPILGLLEFSTSFILSLLDGDDRSFEKLELGIHSYFFFEMILLWQKTIFNKPSHYKEWKGLV